MFSLFLSEFIDLYITRNFFVGGGRVLREGVGKALGMGLGRGEDFWG